MADCGRTCPKLGRLDPKSTDIGKCRPCVGQIRPAFALKKEFDNWPELGNHWPALREVAGASFRNAQ